MTENALPIAAQLVEYYHGELPGDGARWPRGFRAACQDWCVAKAESNNGADVRWEFKDGSAIVEIAGLWDYGVHRDRISAAFDLTTAEEDVYFVWPESHPAIPAAWTGPPPPPEED